MKKEIKIGPFTIHTDPVTYPAEPQFKPRIRIRVNNLTYGIYVGYSLSETNNIMVNLMLTFPGSIITQNNE